MKLQILPAKQGTVWIQSAFALMKKQALGLTGIFALLLTMGMLLSLFPLIGAFFSLAILPTVSLCMMLAAQKVESGHFPMPSLLSEVVQAGQTQKRALLILGALYAVAVMVLLGLIGAGSGDMIEKAMQAQNDPEAAKTLMQSSHFLPSVMAMGTGMAILSLVFWHAPALVYWHGISPLKSLFFSLVACVRNVKAYLVFGLSLMGLYLACSVMILLVGSLIPILTLPVMYLLYLFTGTLSSIAAYFAYQDSFISSGEAPDTALEPAPRPPPPSPPLPPQPPTS